MTPEQYVKNENKITGKPIFLDKKAERAFLRVFGSESKTKYKMVPSCDRWCTNKLALTFKSKKYRLKTTMLIYYEDGYIRASCIDEPNIENACAYFIIGFNKSTTIYNTFFRNILKLFVLRYNILVAIATARDIANRI